MSVESYLEQDIHISSSCSGLCLGLECWKVVTVGVLHLQILVLFLWTASGLCFFYFHG